MNRSDIIKNVKKNFSVLHYSEAKCLVDLFFDNIKKNLLDEKEVLISNFGSFALHTRKYTKFVNPKNNKTYYIPTSVVLSFKASDSLLKNLREIS